MKELEKNYLEIKEECGESKKLPQKTICPHCGNIKKKISINSELGKFDKIQFIETVMKLTTHNITIYRSGRCCSCDFN